MRPNDRPRLADRVQGIPPFHVMEVVREAQRLESQGVDVIHLEVGEPDFESPAPVVSEAIRALGAGHTRYTDARGILALREAISQWYGNQGLQVPADRIQITQGASAALLLATAVTTNPEEGVLMADPAYPCNPRFIETVGASVHWLQTRAEDAFQPTRQMLEASAQARDRTLMLAHPANPTGMAVPDSELTAMLAWCRETSRHAIVDEIYLSLSFDSVRSSLATGDQQFVAGSFSKYFNMTGWRLGWLVVPEYALAATQKLAQHLFICAPSFAQEAAVACFTPEVLALAEARRTELQARRDQLIPALATLGFEIAAVPNGAFYVFVDAKAVTCDAQAFCLDVIRQTGVAMTPGIDFSSTLPNTWIRIAYTQPIERLLDAVQRIARYLNG